jgi:diguanylate cyclase (GGDEF)-like protein
MALDRALARGGIAAALVLMLGIGVVSYRSAVAQTEATASVTRTHQVIEELQKIVSGVAEAESALRGYAIMRDPRLLTDFEPGIALAQHGLSRVSELSRDNALLSRRLSEVRPLLRERVELLQGRRAALQGGAVAHVSPDAVRISEHIRTLVNEGIALERELLTERSSVATAKASRQRTITMIGLLASIALVVVASSLIEREMRHRRAAQQERLRELSLLLELGELMQACRTLDEAFDVILRTGPRFFPASSGAVSLFLASRNAVEVRAAWGEASAFAQKSFEPEQCWGLRRGRMHLSQAEGSAMICGHLSESRPAHAACMPLIANGELLGALHLVDGAGMSAELQQRMGVFGEQVALAVANLQLRETLRNQSTRDPLTGLFNRRYCEETLTRELARAQRETAPLSVLMLDVDHFKKVNDTYGHETGDVVLKEIAAVLQKQTRRSDVAGRLGGEELLVLMPNADRDCATKKAEALRASVAELAIRAHGRPIERVTVSIGVATFPEHGKSADELTRAADAALYRAKHEGRDRVCLAE